MREWFPTAAAYIEGLPDGLDSYPEIQTKASLVRSTLDGRAFPRARLPDLPPVLRQMVEAPYPVSKWIPEVHSHATVLAVGDTMCKSPEDFERYSYVRQRRLFEGPLYKVALKMASPRFLFRAAAYRWSSFHRGTVLEIERAEAEEVQVVIHHPTGLWNDPMRVVLAAGFRAVLDINGAQGTSIDFSDASPEHTRMIGRWRNPR